MFVHALIRVSVLGVALPTSSAFISVEVTNLHGEAWCCLSLHVRLAWGGTELVDVLVFRFVFPLFSAFVVSAVIAVIIQRHIKHIVQYTIQATMQIHALSAKQVSKEAPRLTCQ